MIYLEPYHKTSISQKNNTDYTKASMAHAVYQTKAYILQTITRKEANEILVCFSERFGLIYVSSQSTRKQSSKMRMHIHNNSLVMIDVVQGRGMWRLTGIHPLVSSFFYVESGWYPLMVRYGETMMRLLAGEESHAEVWDDVEQLFTAIQEDKKVKAAPVYEIIMMARLLYHLGYWNDNYMFIKDSLTFDDTYIAEVRKNKTKIIKHINHGLSISQL